MADAVPSLRQLSMDSIVKDRLSKSPLASRIPKHLCKILFPKLLKHSIENCPNIIPLLRLMVVEDFMVDDLFLTKDLITPILSCTSRMISFFKILNEGRYFKSLHISKDIPISLLFPPLPKPSKRRKILHKQQYNLEYNIYLPSPLSSTTTPNILTDAFQIEKTRFVPNNK